MLASRENPQSSSFVRLFQANKRVGVGKGERVGVSVIQKKIISGDVFNVVQSFFITMHNMQLYNNLSTELRQIIIQLDVVSFNE